MRGDDSLALVADVDQDLVPVDPDNLSADDVSFFEVDERRVVVDGGRSSRRLLFSSGHVWRSSLAVNDRDRPSAFTIGLRPGVETRPVPFAAFALALSSAFVHALWNLLLARARDSEAATAVALIAGTIAFAPVAAITWDLDSGVWPYLAASATLEIAYFALLAAAYDRGELSVVYPVARGSAPLLVALFSVLLLGTALHALTVVGIALVAGGVLLVRGVTPLQTGDSVGFALLIGATV